MKKNSYTEAEVLEIIDHVTEAIEDQLKKGEKVESEHKKTYERIKTHFERTGEMMPENMFFRHIAKDHLKEHSDYYDRLLKAGL